MIVVPGAAFPEAIQKQRVAIAGVNRRRANRQIRPVESRNNGTLLRNAETGTNIFDNGGRRRRCQSQNPFGI